jgi:hypothetical protein
MRIARNDSLDYRKFKVKKLKRNVVIPKNKSGIFDRFVWSERFGIKIRRCKIRKILE